MMKAQHLVTIAALGAVLTGCGGAKPASAPAAPAAPAAAPAAPAFDKLIVVADTVRGNVNLSKEEMDLKHCVSQSKYQHNERVVFRIKVLDPKTGAYLDDAALGEVAIKMGDGQVIPAKYGDHKTDKFWAAGFTIPENYPTGTAKWTVSATGKDGRTSKQVDFTVPLSDFTVLKGAVPVVPKA